MTLEVPICGFVNLVLLFSINGDNFWYYLQRMTVKVK